MNRWQDLAKLAETLGGLPVLACRPDSPAARAGIGYGDIVLSVNGRPTPDWCAFVEARAIDATRMVLEVFRDGRTCRLEVQLTQGERVQPAELLASLIEERVLPRESIPPPGEKPN